MSTQEMLDKLKNGGANPNAPDEKKAEEKKYQHYNSSRIALQMITKTGRKISFANFTFVTDDQELMDYLNDEIARGNGYITKGELLTHAEADPMVAIKRQAVEEYLAQKAEEARAAALGEVRNMGSTDPNQKINVATTADQPK